MKKIELSKTQLEGIEKFHRFMESERQEFVFCGAAGTGKSTCVKEATKNYDYTYAAPTGKAANIIKNKTGVPASTLHSLFMEPRDHPVVAAAKREVWIAEQRGEDAKAEQLQLIVEDLINSYPPVGFVEKSPLPSIDLLVCDEASMVDEDMWEIATRACKKILWIGDHAQLNPVKGKRSPINSLHHDVELNEVHRQDENSDALKWATKVRMGEKCPECRISQSEFWHRLVFDDNAQILVGTNASRAYFNAKKRIVKVNDINRLPQKGEPMMVLRNNHDLGVMNGEILTCEKFYTFGGKYEAVLSRNLNGKKETISLEMWHSEFESIDKIGPNGGFKLGFGYAMTVHKSQGSEWDNVLVVSDRPTWPPEYKNWLYTAITRTSDQVGVCYDFNKDIMQHELSKMLKGQIK